MEAKSIVCFASSIRSTISTRSALRAVRNQRISAAHSTSCLRQLQAKTGDALLDRRARPSNRFDLIATQLEIMLQLVWFMISLATAAADF